jgi:tyrosyl-tRNA synthetase
LRVANVLRQAGLVASNKEGQRQIQQGGVRLDGEVVTDPELALSLDELDGATLQVGKRKWVRLKNPRNA